MDAITARPSLLSAAKNFIRKSAGTAVVVIAPLAAITVTNEAKAQTVFGTAQTSGAVSNVVSGAAVYAGNSGFFSQALTPANGITGVSFGLNMNAFVSGSFAISYLTGYYSSVFSTAGGSLAVNDSIPFAYDFTISHAGGMSNISWTLNVDLQDSSEPPAHFSFNGTGSGNISDSTSLTISSVDNPNGLPSFYNWSATLQVYFEAADGGVLDVTMNQGSGQGLAFNAVSAVPEPSTYALLFGVGAFGFVLLRRSRRAAT